MTYHDALVAVDDVGFVFGRLLVLVEADVGLAQAVLLALEAL